MSNDAEKIITEIRERFGIDVERLVKMDLLPLSAAKKCLVREMYFHHARNGKTVDKGGRTYTDIKNQLSDEYGISISSIEKIIYRRSN